MPINRGVPTKPSPPPIDITTEGQGSVRASDGVVVGASEQGMGGAPASRGLPDADRLVGGGETSDGIPFLVERGPDGQNIMLATGVGTKPRTAAKVSPDAASFKEAGSASPSPFTSALRQDPNRLLRGQAGIGQYREMWRSNGAVRRAIRRFQTPIESARWTVIPGDDSANAKKQAEFVSQNLFDGLDVTWAQTLADINLMIRYGYSILNKVYIRDTTPGGGAMIRLAKLAPRHPLEVEHVEYDEFGSPLKIWFYPSGAYEVRTDGQAYAIGGGGGGGKGNIPIDIAELVVFTLDGEAGDLQGTSVLRAAYGHWMMMNALMKIDAVQKERHAVGVPVITLPPGATKADLTLAEEIGRNLRANERAHVVLPDPNWKLEWAKIEGSVVDPLKSAQWHSEQIEKNVLWGDSDNEYDLFMKSTRYVADRIADTLNRWVVKELVDFNWANTKVYPKITPRWIGEFEDMRTRSFAIRNLVGAALITPDEMLESQLRKELDLPMADLATRRVVEAPQNAQGDGAGDGTDGTDPAKPGDKAKAGTNTPGTPTTKQDGAKVGTARQAKPPSGKQKPNAGTDRSGGTN